MFPATQRDCPLAREIVRYIRWVDSTICSFFCGHWSPSLSQRSVRSSLKACSSRYFPGSEMRSMPNFSGLFPQGESLIR